MKFFRRLFCAGAVWLLASTAAVRATNNHQYGPDEYGTVTQGASPDGKYAIATHGEGDLGYEHFHVYLMNAKTGHKIGPLTEIGEKDILDTAPEAFIAKWSADSGRVTIQWRRGRHEPVKIVYRIANGRAYLISGPVPGTID